MQMDVDELYDVIYKEKGNGEIISANIVIKDTNSGDIRVYSADEYGKFNTYTIKN